MDPGGGGESRGAVAATRYAAGRAMAPMNASRATSPVVLCPAAGRPSHSSAGHSQLGLRPCLLLGLTVGVLAAGQAACGAPCTTPLVIRPTIMVVDAKTQVPICDAEILITSDDGNGSGTGAAIQDAAPTAVDAGLDGSKPLGFIAGNDASHEACKYSTGLLTGVFTLQVSYPGYKTETVSNVYSQTSCVSSGATPPQSEVVTVYLHPTGS